MTKTARRAMAGSAAVVVALLGWTSSAAAMESGEALASDETLTETNSRVRGLSGRVAAVIIEAAAQSKTFRGLVDQLGTTDGIVFVAEGECWHGVDACLLMTMTIAGSNRMLWILVDAQKANRDLMGSIGHELQHAVEVLSNPWVTSSDAMYRFYKTRCYACRMRFETDAAIRAGVAVRDEVQNSAAAEDRSEKPSPRVLSHKP